MNKNKSELLEFQDNEPYAYDVPTSDGTELAYSIFFTKYGNPLPEGSIALYSDQFEQTKTWISVKDRLPEKFVEVLIYPRPTDYCCEGQWEGDGWYYAEYTSGSGLERYEFEVTHWMPSPYDNEPTIETKDENKAE